MRICMFLMNEFTLDARVTKEARTLTNDGHKVLVAALKSKDTPEWEKRDNFNIYRITVHLRYLLPKGQLFFFLKYIEYILQNIKKLRKKKFDVYHAHDLETLPAGYILSLIHKKPLVYDSHELYVDCVQHNSLARKFWYYMEKFLSSKTTVTIMETKSRAKIFSQRYSVKPPTVIMNCQYLNLSIKTNVLRKRLHIPTKEKIILYQGQIAPSRGVDVLLKSIEFLDNAVLVFLGPGDYKEEIRMKVERNKKRNKIFVLNPVPWEELATYTASADIGVFPLQNDSLHYYYALSNKLFEYLSSGLPVVFSDFPEMRKIIIENEVGFVVDETDPVAIADAISRILNNPTLYKKMSDNAKRIVKEKYNWAIEGKKLLTIYSNINK